MLLPFTAAQAVARARSQVGYVEQASNKTKYGAAYGWDDVPWCGELMWWVFYSLGVDIRRLGISAPVSTNAFDAGAARVGWRRIRSASVQAGDLLFFNFGDLDGPRGPDTANDDDHVGMATGRPTRGFVATIEGNTSPGSGGSQANGGGVYPRTRSITLIRHAYRPAYSTAAQVKALARARDAAEKAKKAAAANKKRVALLASKRAQAAAAAIAAALAAGGGTVIVTTGSDPTSKPGVTVSPTATATPAHPTPTKTTKPKPAPKPAQTRTLRYVKGRPLMRGKDVGRVQVLIGFHGKDVDDAYGSNTTAGVKRWQRRHDLKPTGVWGETATKAAGWVWKPQR